MNSSEIDNRYMEFRLGGQLYAIPLLTVKEVIPKPEITSVPNMPSHFEGMFNLRGQILGVFNVRRKLAIKVANSTEKSGDVVIVIEQQGVSVGMIVDEVTRVLHPTPDMIGPAPLKEEDPTRHFISAVIQSEKDLIMVLQSDKLLDLEKYKAMAQAS